MIIPDLLGVLVLYNCSLEESITLSSLNQSLEKTKKQLTLIVYDNSKTRQYKEDVFNFKNFCVIYVSNPKNPGVSSAYNYGALFASKKEFKWLLLLDQDSEFPLDFVNEIIDITQTNPKISIFAPKLICRELVLSPSSYYFKRGSVSNIKLQTGINSLKNTTFLNSGLTINVNTFNRCGGYKTTVRLYFSDYVFIDRLRKFTNNYYLLNSILQHDLSSNNEDNYNEFLARFNLFVEGAFYAGDHIFEKFQYLATSFLRTIKHTLKYKTFSFIKIWVSWYILKRSN